MKFLILGNAFILFTSIAVKAETPTTTMFIVQKQSGFVAAEQSYRIDCQVDASKTNLVWTSGRDPKTYESHLATRFTTALPDAPAVRAALKKAAHSKLQHSSGPTDFPTSRYFGVIGGVVVDRYVKLLIDRSTNIYRNTAPKTDALLELADLNCSIP